MDAKEQMLVAELHRRVKAVAFHERDILALLILLREHSTNGSPVRELSDFVAHREKNRGALKEYVHHVVSYCQAMVDGTAGSLKVNVVHTAAAFRTAINISLNRFDLEALDVDRSNDVLACAMSLLQAVRLFHNRTPIGQFVLTRTKRDLYLNGVVQMPGPKQIKVVLPALSVPNRYCSMAAAGKIGDFPGLVEARCTKGRLSLYVAGTEVAP